MKRPPRLSADTISIIARTFETERARADSAEAERVAHTASETRIRVLEAELRRLCGC